MNENQTMTYEYFTEQTPMGAILHGQDERIKRVCYASYLMGKLEYHDQMFKMFAMNMQDIPHWTDEWHKMKGDHCG